ncbi:hypothetical protein [Flindersiella endophytica]
MMVSTAHSGQSGSVTSAGRRRATLEQLRAELATTQVAATVPTDPAFSRLLSGPGLRKGAVYAVADQADRTAGPSASTSVILGLLAGPSQAGLWCGVAGLPGLGVEAAAGYGIDLRRLVLVPSPGPRWLEVVGALADVLDVVVVEPPAPAPDAQTRRLAARLRERGTVLIVAGSAGRAGAGTRAERNLAWPGCEVQFAVTSSQWSGLGEGHGYLAQRQVTVEASGRGVGWQPRTTNLWLPGDDGRLTQVEETAPVLPLTRAFADREQQKAS